MLLGMEVGMIGASMANALMTCLGYWQVFSKVNAYSDDEDDFDGENTCLLKDTKLFTMLTTKLEIPPELPTES